ncbi:hypothetical protein AB6T38_13220 [Aliiglaciecola sp. SL4]|uniref:hypothetical protein n=1 Tax=Aliiglaciecola sp. SL4 TaxID=3239806 RepID=UPI00355C8BF8
MPLETVKSTFANTNRKTWVYGVLIMLIFAALGYYTLLNQKDRTANHDYYRVLYEASNEFKENLNKLDSMHRYKEGVSSIRSLLPSYTRKADSEQNLLHADGFKYSIIGQSLQVNADLPGSDKAFEAELSFEDILPNPKKGFSQYLFADKDGKVIATVGDESTISIVELRSINQQIQRKNKQFQFNFSESQSIDASSAPPPLPTYSNHVDMKISYGDFRVFVFPFALEIPLRKSSAVENEGDQEVIVELDKLYLVGLLPQSKLSNRENNDWNLSLLVVTLVSLLFIWCLLRLFLLPQNQSITRSFRLLTVASSYAFFIVIIALALGYMQKYLLQLEKDQKATEYASYLDQKLKRDINEVFSRLEQYQTFYTEILETLETFSEISQVYSGFTAENLTTFNQSMKKAILSLNAQHCINNKPAYWLPGSASTPNKTYAIQYDCSLPSDNPQFMQLALDEHAINVMLKAFNSNKANEVTLDFYSNIQKLDLVPEESLNTSVAAPFLQDKSRTILSSFAINKEGNSVLPSLNFQESNALPATFNLSHRNYYKKVRDQKGWDIQRLPTANQPNAASGHSDKTSIASFSPAASLFKNVYIQRLLNVTNGTRGTTISMPISPTNSNKTYDYILAADVLLPSMTLGQSPPYDFNYMVVERSTGDVLFHNDSSRSLVENLYFTGDSHSALSKWLKAGLDHYPELGKELIEGSYHGQSGRFAISSTVVDRWAIVIFYPNDSLQTFMSNQFLYVMTTFAVIIALMVVGIYAVRHFIWTSTLKEKLRLPAKLNVRLVMLVSSVLFSASYCLYFIGHNIDTLFNHGAGFNWSLWLPILGLSIATVFVYRGCYNHFCFPFNQLNTPTLVSAKRGSRRLIIAVLIAIGIHFLYLQKTADTPEKSLDFHYQQLACNWLNYERQEVNSIGLSRYPNSITSNRIAPINLLPIDNNWRKRLTSKGGDCQNLSTQIHPDDYPSLSSVFSATYLWQWINIYILDRDLAANYQPNSDFRTYKHREPDGLVSSILFYIGLFAVIIWAWFRFNTQLLWNRLYCPERFLQHINRMTRSVQTLHFEQRSDNLKIECDTIKLNGIGLSLLLRSMGLKGANTEKSPQTTSLLAGFETLFSMSPCLQKFSEENSFLPNLKLNIVHQEENRIAVEIWDIETCLEKSEFRQLLLDLIMEIKSLTLSGQLASFTIYTGFHSLQRVKMKDPLMLDQSSVLDHAEYLSWAECLMDFIVVIPESFKQGIDWQMLREEVSGFPELQFLQQEVEQAEQQETWAHVWKRDEQQNIESRWSTINYILLNAEALYRFKWESCSSAEKLALLNLAKRQKLNPANTQMIEHLALNGLITVRKGNIEVVNRSFTHFILHAETKTTLNQLVKHGEEGLWKSYRLPLGVIIILIIGGIALTSGESIYIIAASMAGVLGTIASVTNSANLLRGQMRE